MAGGEPIEIFAVERDEHGVCFVERLFWNQEDANSYIAELNMQFPMGFKRLIRRWRVH